MLDAHLQSLKLERRSVELGQGGSVLIGLVREGGAARWGARCCAAGAGSGPGGSWVVAPRAVVGVAEVLLLPGVPWARWPQRRQPMGCLGLVGRLRSAKGAKVLRVRAIGPLARYVAWGNLCCSRLGDRYTASVPDAGQRPGRRVRMSLGRVLRVPSVGVAPSPGPAAGPGGVLPFVWVPCPLRQVERAARHFDVWSAARMGLGRCARAGS